MGVFDAATRVKQYVAQSTTDHTLPHPKSLSWATISTEAALAGTTGQNCDVIHGDQVHKINGNHLQTIRDDQTLQVGQNHKETICGTTTQSMIGPQTVTNFSVRNESRLDAFTLVYGENECCQDADGDKDVKPTDFDAVYIVSGEYQTLKHEAVVAHAEVTLAHAEGQLAHYSFVLADASNTIIGDDVKALENRVVALRNNVGAVIATVALDATDLVQLRMCEMIFGANQAL